MHEDKLSSDIISSRNKLISQMFQDDGHVHVVAAYTLHFVQYNSIHHIVFCFCVNQQTRMQIVRKQIMHHEPKHNIT